MTTDQLTMASLLPMSLFRRLSTLSRTLVVLPITSSIFPESTMLTVASLAGTFDRRTCESANTSAVNNLTIAGRWNPKKVSLVPGSPVGTALEAVEVTGPILSPKLRHVTEFALAKSSPDTDFSLNPGRIDPNNSVWVDSRKPLAAHWQTTNGHRFFTVNLHLESKGGSTTEEGNARPPVNLPVDKRTGQVNVTAVRYFHFVVGFDVLI
jgi:hypothetical protein